MKTLLKKAAMVALSAALSAAAVAEDKLKIGFVYVGPVGDAGWTYGHDEGRKEMLENLGDKVETTFVESVSEGADSERVIRKLAQQGNDLILQHHSAI